MKDSKTFSVPIANKEKFAPPAVLVQNVCKSFNINGSSHPVLSNISMQVEQGIIYGLLGSSGCGKTTLLSCIVGLKTWDSGDVFVFGNKVDEDFSTTHGHIMGYMPQDLALYKQLSIKEMIKYYGKLYGMDSSAVEQEWLYLVTLLNLPEGSNSINNLSGGQMRRVSFALALLHKPQLLILDEPTVGLDPLLRKNVWNYLLNLANVNKSSIIITTHYIEEVRQSDKVGVMRNGKLLVEDNPMTLMNTHRTSLLEEVVLKICRKDQNAFDEDSQTQKDSQETIISSKIGVANNVEKPSYFQKWFCGSSPNFVDPVNLTRISWLEENSTQNSSTANRGLTSSRQSGDEKCTEIRHGHGNLKTFMRRTLAYSQVVSINFIRHPVFIGLVLLLPLMQLVTTCMVVGVEPKYARIGLINHERLNWTSSCTEENTISNFGKTCSITLLSCGLIGYLNSSTYLNLVEYHTNEVAHLAATRGDLIGYIQIPENYSTHMINRATFKMFADDRTVNGSKISIYMDMSVSVTAYVVLSNLFKLFQKFVSEVASSCNVDLSLLEVPVVYKDPVYGTLDGSPQEYAVPALIAGIIFEISFIITPLILIDDIKQGTLHRAQVAGLRFTELMAGIFLNMATLTVVQALLCYLVLEFGLGFVIHGSVLLFVILCLLTALCGGTFGLLVGLINEDATAVILWAIAIIPILMLYTGLFRPVEVVKPV